MHVLQHPSADLQHSAIGAMLDIVAMIISNFIMLKLDYCNVALAICNAAIWTECSLLSLLLHVLQSVHSGMTTSIRYLWTLLAGMPHCIQCILCVLVRQCVHEPAPIYLKNAICPVASTEPRHRLCSASSVDLVMPASHCLTLADRTFAVAGPCA